MAGNVTYPPGGQPPDTPVFRGVDESLSGKLGDLVTGTYNRSPNVFVLDAHSIEKRRGFTRAFDEAFPGYAVVARHRVADGTNYQAIADSDGIKVLTAMPVKEQPEGNLNHNGFPLDDFERADSATVQGSDPFKPWDEGQGSAADSTNFPVGSDWEIRSGGCAIHITADSTETGNLDKPETAPGAFYVTTLELDMTSLIASTVLRTHFMTIAQGIPDVHAHGGAVYNARTEVADAADEASGQTVFNVPIWSGFSLNLLWYQINGKFVVDFELYEYLSDQNTDNRQAANINGYKRLIEAERFEFADEASLKKTHTLELGRIALDQGGQPGYRVRARFWQNKTIKQVTSNDAADVDIDSGLKRFDEAELIGGTTWYSTLPWGDGANGRGYWGLYGKAVRAGTDTQIKVNEIQVSEQFR